ncbi:hypothetical protein [Bacillus sp. EAC]|uniref:hypothetical protein n=1 Tax=Bacillus sp. EAC TaxID=1978338 RepID=UPI000B43F328|nr:hypothetical protein [Bacillus sp. EAC]
MNLSSILFITLKSILGMIVFDILLVLICYALGSYFNILHSFTLFGFKIIVVPYSALAFLISYIYFFKMNRTNSDEVNEQENLEFSSRMEKFHSKENEPN